MFFQHPLTIEHRYSLHAARALPAWKRMVDLACGIAALPVLAVLTFVCGLIGAVSSRGPVFYRQHFMGAFGRKFVGLRFRTMHVVTWNAAPALLNGASHRTTSPLIFGGRFLRATGLADLPQIINVLRGEMSIVGPRPRVASGDASNRSPESHDRVAPPGLTGVWRYARQSPAADEASLQWERAYASQMSPVADAKVMVRTLFALVGVRLNQPKG